MLPVTLLVVVVQSAKSCPSQVQPIALIAFLGNSMVMLVWLHVNLAQKTRITETKEDAALASTVPRDGSPPVAVQNANRAVQGRSVMVAKVAHWDLQDKEMTLMRRSADHVHWGKQRR